MPPMRSRCSGLSCSFSGPAFTLTQPLLRKNIWRCESCLTEPANGAQHFLGSSTEILCSGVEAGVFSSWCSLAQIEGMSLMHPWINTGWPKNPLSAFSCHQFQQGSGTARHFRGQLRKSLWILSISQGYTRLVEGEPHMMAVLSPGSGGSKMPDTATTSHSPGWVPWKSHWKSSPVTAGISLWTQTQWSILALGACHSHNKSASLQAANRGFMGW